MQKAAADWLIDSVLAAHASGERLGPDAATLLAREFAHSGRAELGEVSGLLVARGLDEAARVAPWNPAPTEGRLDPASERAAWLTLFLDIASISDDERLTPAIADLSRSIVVTWAGSERVGATMRGIDACLRAAVLIDPPMISRIVDELERLIAWAYRPGEGVISQAGKTPPVGVDDHAQAAAALVTAYSVTSRLPYGMLADDLMQFARRSWWADEIAPLSTPEGVASFSTAARVLVRLAAIHREPQYVQAAVVTEGYAHLADAARLLAASAEAAAGLGWSACVHALADAELRSAMDTG